MDASISDVDMRRNRANALLYTTTMQKVGCPRTIVQKLNGILPILKALLREIPVMIPGRAIGSIINKEMVSWPKNFLL